MTLQPNHLSVSLPAATAWEEAANAATAARELHLGILDVGQGDGMVIWLPNGKVMMVDYGTTRKKVLNTLLIHDTFEYFRTHIPFKDKGTSLEWLVLTHADSDHYNIVRNFLTIFEVNVRNVLYGGLPGDYADKLIPWLENRNPDKTKIVVQTATNGNLFSSTLSRTWASR